MAEQQVARFSIDELVKELRAASTQTTAVAKVRAIMDRAFAEPQIVDAHMPEYEDDDVVLYEDDDISVWHCRFRPGVAVPPHDHQVSATIGVYRGTERNDFYKAGENGITPSNGVDMTPGSVVSIGPSAIHSVICTSDEPSCGIHVYHGPLTRVERHLFDVRAGKTLAFNDEDYARLRDESGQIKTPD